MIDADAIEEVARRLDSLARTIDADHSGLIRSAVAALGAIPPSDLQASYEYCWGRWSQALVDALGGLSSAAISARRVAADWRSTEHHVAERIRRSSDGRRQR